MPALHLSTLINQKAGAPSAAGSLMSIDVLTDVGAVLRHDVHVTRAVHHRGLFRVLRVALVAWWTCPRIPPDMPARLRADMGLPPAPKSMFWPEPDDYWPLPVPLWKP